MSPCDDIRALLPLYVGEDLEPGQAERVRIHLDGAVSPAALSGAGSGGRTRGCAPCTQVLEDLRAVRQQFQDLPQRSPAPSIELWPEVRAALAREGWLATRPGEPAGPVRVLRPARRLHLGHRLVSAAAAVALIVLGARWLRDDAVVEDATQRSGGIAEITPTDTSTPSVADSERVTDPPRVADLGSESGPTPSLEVPSTGGLRRLEPGEEPLHRGALPFVYGTHGWPGSYLLPIGPRAPIDPSQPTFASDRSPR